ncbi:YybH family protein [Nocardia sp. CA-084685]|uniref:YybH family protein n=1 Tax=Nocardia sp. CA-084685 TaxID=3239970 RepID=UPI003D96C16E
MSPYPGTTDPHQLTVLFIDYFEAGDIDGLLSLYEDDAILIGPDGTRADEPDSRRKSFEQLFALNTKVEVINKTLLVLRDEALSHGHLRLEAEGLPTTEIRTAEIFRCQTDGTWKVSIDNAIGSAILG